MHPNQLSQARTAPNGADATLQYSGHVANRLIHERKHAFVLRRCLRMVRLCRRRVERSPFAFSPSAAHPSAVKWNEITKEDKTHLHLFNLEQSERRGEKMRLISPRSALTHIRLGPIDSFGIHKTLCSSTCFQICSRAVCRFSFPAARPLRSQIQ